MHDGSNDFPDKPRKTRESKQFGLLFEGEAFVQHEYEPDDDHTRDSVFSLLRQLELPYGAGKNQMRYVRCLSDVLVAIRSAPNGLFCWPMQNGEFTGEVYTSHIARQVREALQARGWVTVEQEASKSDGLARLYWGYSGIASPKYRFRCHGGGASVIVRTKQTTRGKKTYGGKRLPRKRFLPQIEPLEKQVKQVNAFHKDHPLVLPNGELRSRCRRIFNNGSLKVGGRLYAPWQQMPEDERLTCTIDGEAVCEIDLKASYLSIVYAIVEGGNDLGFDPYAKVRCVREADSKERREELRGLIKFLIMTYVSQAMHHPDKEPLTRYPQGKRIKDEETGEVNFFTTRQRFEVEEPVEFYKEQILEAFPFLERVRECPYDVMYMESEIMLHSIESLNAQEIPAYPVHDCLLVKLSDKQAALDAMQESQIKYLGRSIHMDCSYLVEGEDGSIAKKTEELTKEVTVDFEEGGEFQNLSFHWGAIEDFEVIEDI